MLKSETFYNELRKNEIDFFTGVPDSLLKSLCAYISDNSSNADHIIAANEGGAVALAIGYHFATGKIPLVYMQNSGLGNAINPLLSLADSEIYAVPMLLVLGWRGQPGIKDEPQHVKQGRVMLKMLDAMEIPYLVLSKDITQASEQLKTAVKTAKQKSSPFAIVIEKDTFENYTLIKDNALDVDLTREQAIETVVQQLKSKDAVVATTGMASRELFEIRKKLDMNGETDFLTIGGMGHASQIALGIALSQPLRKVLCIDGDGSVLMHMGSMAIISQCKCPQFIHIVINNGAHDSVGGQPTAAAQLNLGQIARAVGYQNIFSASTKEEISSSIAHAVSSAGLTFLEIKTRKGARKDLGRPTSSSHENKDKFMSFLQCN